MCSTLFPILRERQKQDATTLSGGEQQMCAIGRGIMSRPKLLMIDELSLGLAPRLVERLSEALIEINRNGLTILLVEQDVMTAFEIARHALVIETGRVSMTARRRRSPTIQRSARPISACESPAGSMLGQQAAETFDAVVDAVRAQRRPVGRDIDRDHRNAEPAFGLAGKIGHSEVSTRLNDGVDALGGQRLQAVP